MKANVIIIGGGPGGTFCAFYLKRFGIDCLVFEKNEIGGTSRYANLIENFPFLAPLSGLQFKNKLKNMVKKNGIKIIYENVKKIDFKDDYFIIKTTKKNYFSKYLILATGTKPVIIKEYKELKEEIDNFEKKFFSVKSKKVCVIGGGDIAFDYALNLAKRKNRVSLIFRGIRTIEILKKRCLKSKYINLIGPSRIKKILKKRDFYEVLFRTDGGTIKDKFDLVFLACGRRTHYGDIENIDKIICDRKLKGRFFICGDVKNKRFRQIVNCASDAMNISMKIKELEYEGGSQVWQ